MAKQKQPTQRELEDQVNDFNERYPVGSKLKLKKDSGAVIDVTVSSPATILSGHSAVGWFEEVSGCYSIDSIEEYQPITKEEFEAGVEFFHSPKSGKFDYMDTFHRDAKRYIANKENRFYCHIQLIDDDGFLGIHYLFGQPNEVKVLFKNCFKAQTK